MAEASEAGCGIPSTADLLEQVAVSLAQDQKKAEEQAEAAFNLYDYSAQGIISREELTRHFSAVFKVMS